MVEELVALVSDLFQSHIIFMSTELLCWLVFSLGTLCIRPHLLGALYLVHAACVCGWAPKHVCSGLSLPRFLVFLN